ncbi:MAG TPA: endopeptidase La [Deltaproteobacteria bacterium]|nr:endopeptidase La [Deltaproteobacteria bacterium]HPJ92855.1 endopeptidase La [Deltaproteobacteria bacterium]
MDWIKSIFGKSIESKPVLEIEDYPEILPVLPLKDAVLVPGGMLPLIVSNPVSITLIKKLHEAKSPVAAVGMKEPKDIDPAMWDNLYRIGCMAQISKISVTKKNDLSIMIKGIRKILLEEKTTDEPYLNARVSYLTEDLVPDKQVYALALSTSETLEQLAKLSYHNLDSVLSNLSKIKDPVMMLSTATTNLPLPLKKKQQILEESDFIEKFTILYQTLREELEILEISSKITEKARGEINNAQREYYLRQQLKAIKKELGEAPGDADDEMAELKKEIEAKGLPEEVKPEVDKDLKRIARMQVGSSEYVTIRTYLDWILDLPWSETSQDNLDIVNVEGILDEDHFNLKRPKKRILEFLSVKKLKSDLKGPILCFVGPPGVGKTSLGRSIARAMGREFIRISLGGVRDEAEIRGHRRTYIGAMPGRIINGIKLAGTTNPVFMLDEIDKLSHDIHGDPASALLEALDPEQNSHFVDHYLNVPYDLSNVFFITTANVVDTIPMALKDRMEIVEIEGYTQEDKLQIARNYLIPKEIEANGLAGRTIDVTDEAVDHIIRSYTRESGVRNLQREIASCLRVIASTVAKHGGDDFVVNPSFVEEALGPVRFTPEVKQRTRIPGIATGLAWTPFGGEILFIESALVGGKDEMILTGQIGDVMKESARLALSIIKSAGCPDWEGRCLHIHVPAGAIPKDGPSAGVTIVTSIISLIMGKVVRENLAMTGEITLRGVVLPVGGIKEKVLAARREGITEIILPRMNEKDLRDIDAGVLKDLHIHYVDNIDEVLKLAFPEAKEDVLPLLSPDTFDKKKPLSPDLRA